MGIPTVSRILASAIDRGQTIADTHVLLPLKSKEPHGVVAINRFTQTKAHALFFQVAEFDGRIGQAEPMSRVALRIRSYFAVGQFVVTDTKKFTIKQNDGSMTYQSTYSSMYRKSEKPNPVIAFREFITRWEEHALSASAHKDKDGENLRITIAAADCPFVIPLNDTDVRRVSESNASAVGWMYEKASAQWSELVKSVDGDGNFRIDGSTSDPLIERVGIAAVTYKIVQLMQSYDPDSTVSTDIPVFDNTRPETIGSGPFA